MFPSPNLDDKNVKIVSWMLWLSSNSSSFNCVWVSNDSYYFVYQPKKNCKDWQAICHVIRVGGLYVLIWLVRLVYSNGGFISPTNQEIEINYINHTPNKLRNRIQWLTIEWKTNVQLRGSSELFGGSRCLPNFVGEDDGCVAGKGLPLSKYDVSVHVKKWELDLVGDAPNPRPCVCRIWRAKWLSLGLVIDLYI